VIVLIGHKSKLALQAVDEAPAWALELLDEIRALRAELARQQGQSTLTRADRAVLAKLLPAIGGVFGSEPFLSSEVCEHDEPGLRLVCTGISIRSLGRLLRRAAGVAVDGYMITRVAVEAGAVLWSVRRLPEFSEGQNSFVPPGASPRSAD
jgi:hypothetical protein